MQERGIFPPPQSAGHQRKELESKLREHGPWWGSVLPVLPGQHPAAAADPGLQSFWPDQSNQSAHLGIAKFNFPWAAELPGPGVLQIMGLSVVEQIGIWKSQLSLEQWGSTNTTKWPRNGYRRLARASFLLSLAKMFPARSSLIYKLHSSNHNNYLCPAIINKVLKDHWFSFSP